MLNVIIVDDEARSRRTLNALIQDYCKDVKVVALAEDVLTAVKSIHQFHPDVVFLDIEMPKYNGFKLIDFFEKLDFEIVITTAYEKYAVQAFNFPAVGYLMKPVDIDELNEVIDNILEKKSLEKERIRTSVQLLMDEQTKRLVLPTRNGFLYLSADEITHLESQGRYTYLYLVNRDKVLSTVSLKKFQDVLKQEHFIRIHRSFIINLDYIQRYSKGVDSFVQLDNHVKIDVGKSYKESLNEALSYFVR